MLTPHIDQPQFINREVLPFRSDDAPHFTQGHPPQQTGVDYYARPSSREDRIRVPTFVLSSILVGFGTLPTQKVSVRGRAPRNPW